MDAADDSDTANPNRIIMTARCPVIQQRYGIFAFVLPVEGIVCTVCGASCIFCIFYRNHTYGIVIRKVGIFLK